VLLAIFAFRCRCSDLPGAFGVLTSVHAFANDPRAGIILLFLAIVIGGSLALFAWRAPKVGLGERFELVSRETMLLTNTCYFCRLRVRCCWARCGRCSSTLWDWRSSRSATVFRRGVRAADDAGLVPDGIGPLARWKQPTCRRSDSGSSGRSASAS